jgi:hypothetical protein
VNQTIQPEQQQPPQPRPLDELYRALGEAIAAVLEHPGCPVAVYNPLLELALEFDNSAVSADSTRRVAVHSRLMLPACLGLLSEERRGRRR